MLSDMSTFSVKEQEQRLKVAMAEEEKVLQEAERVVNWMKQASARLDVSTINKILKDEEPNKFASPAGGSLVLAARRTSTHTFTPLPQIILLDLALVVAAAAGAVVFVVLSFSNGFLRHPHHSLTRAPGKIILAGEHAVVHGSTAVAASIDLYTYASLSFPTHSDNDDKLKLHLKDMALEFAWPVGRIKEALYKLGSQIPSSPASCSPEAMKLIAALVEEQNILEANTTLAAGVSAFLWLYISIQGYKPAKVVITSELPLGSGLGSSAAFCVSVSAALLALSESVNLDFGHQGWLMFGENELELVNKWAFEGEKIIHGKPSGIDNTVSTYGNMIKFRSGELTCLKSNMPLKMLITNTKVGRNTKALVASVSERTVRHSNAMAAVFKAVDSISNEVATILQSPADDDIAVTEKEDKLQELMEMNQGLLQCMGVSHASIETVIRTTLKYKLTTKLTGAGGGGCVLTLLPTLLSGTIVDKVIAELETCGFQCLIAGIGGNGLQISLDSSS